MCVAICVNSVDSLSIVIKILKLTWCGSYSDLVMLYTNYLFLYAALNDGDSLCVHEVKILNTDLKTI
jgi:hypothetical protein